MKDQDKDGIVEIVIKNKKHNPRDQFIQIDLDKADNKVLREIQNYVALR